VFLQFGKLTDSPV